MSANEVIGYRPGEWQPARTWVFAVGVLGNDWPDVPRRDTAFLQTLAQRGVPANHILHLIEEHATTEQIERYLHRHLAAASPGDLVILYFCGHGQCDDENNGSFCVAEDGCWTHASVFASIERYFRGAGALILADCCYSGGIAIEAPHRAGRVAYAALASSLSTEESTGTWSFTDCLIDAFSGTTRVDVDSDGFVTLAELARHVERQMAVMEKQLSSFVVTNDFDADLRIARGAPRPHPLVGQLVAACDEEGKYWDGQIVEVRGGQFRVRCAGYDSDGDMWVGEAALRPWQPTTFAPGEAVEAKSEGKWHRATVLAARRGMHLVNYDEYGNEFDEWVPVDRIRRPR